MHARRKGSHGSWDSLPLQLLVKNIQLEDGKMIPASQLFRGMDNSALELTEEELVTAEAVRVRHTLRAPVQLGRLCTAHVFCKWPCTHSEDVRACPRHGVGSALSWGFSMCPLLCRWALGCGQLGLTPLGTRCQQQTSETGAPAIAEDSDAKLMALQ